MKRLAIADPIRTNEILRHYKLRAKKNFGQNFLVNTGIIYEIVASAAIVPGDQVIEVGPGIGSLTEQLLNAGGKVAAYEIDDDLMEILDNELPETDQLRIINHDVLKSDFVADLADFFDLSKPIKLVANLPYYITTPIIFGFLESSLNIQSMTLMMQKEVADRIISDPGSKNFGPLSIAVQVIMKPRIALNVPPTSFEPAPKVDSAVVVMEKLEQPVEILHREIFDAVVKISFAQRRKTIYNNLKHLVGEGLPDIDSVHQLLEEVDIKENKRAEQLSITDFIAISEYIAKLQSL